MLGLALHHLFPTLVKRVLPVAPLVAVIVIVLICSSIIGDRAGAVRDSGLKLLAAVFLLHCTGFAMGYLLARLLGYEQLIRRTVSIEVGMQNSGLGTGLAEKHFADPLTALPCAISAVFHSVIGSFLAGIWRLRKPEA
jgi:BASS family bile acid:Na+ symporter